MMGYDYQIEWRQIRAQFKKTLCEDRDIGYRTVRDLRDARIACSQSVTHRRAAIRSPWLLREWMQHRLAPSLERSGGWGTPEGGGWSTTQWIDDEHLWGDWGTFAPDPSSSWDGVTRVPKTPGKRKRQRRRRTARRKAQAAATAVILEGIHARMVAAQQERYFLEILPELSPNERAKIWDSWST
ncbi:hypothetical protein K438DRAFT_1961820 [Mycena galopus ATCC 62051]|nr:hypothetical protein K438DRAFT_1961820 [Mycena galopus ATCC 62051]